MVFAGVVELVVGFCEVDDAAQRAGDRVGERMSGRRKWRRGSAEDTVVEGEQRVNVKARPTECVAKASMPHLDRPGRQPLPKA